MSLFMKQVFIPLLVSACLLSSCGKVITPKTEEKIESPTTQQATETPTITIPQVVPTDVNKVEGTSTAKSYTAAEVATHKNGLSCWLILDNKVYDVTAFISKHPNDAILKGCGRDATQMFARHPESAKEMKAQFYIGELKS